MIQIQFHQQLATQVAPRGKNYLALRYVINEINKVDPFVISESSKPKRFRPFNNKLYHDSVNCVGCCMIVLSGTNRYVIHVSGLFIPF